MKIKATVLQTGAISKPTEKDLKKGLRYLTVVVEELKKTFGSEVYQERLIYTIKSVDELDIENGEVCIFDGKLWELRTEDNEPIRGLTLNEIIKLA